MNKTECKKYMKRAIEKIKIKNKEINTLNLELGMLEEIMAESKMYIAYAKVALHNLENSASEITIKQLFEEIDTLPLVYKKSELLLKSKDL